MVDTFPGFLQVLICTRAEVVVELQDFGQTVGLNVGCRCHGIVIGECEMARPTLIMYGIGGQAGSVGGGVSEIAKRPHSAKITC